MCTFRYVCVHWGRDISNVNLLKQRVTVFILIVYFVAQRTPIQGTKPNFTTVDMKQKSTPPSGEDFGLYVHKAEDGWKVKATNDQNKWTTFSIKPFSYQGPPETGKQLWRTSVCTYRRLRNLCNVKAYSEPYCIRVVTFTTTRTLGMGYTLQTFRNLL